MYDLSLISGHLSDAAAGPPGPGRHYFFANNALAGILFLILPSQSVLTAAPVYLDNDFQKITFLRPFIPNLKIFFLQ